MRTYHNFVNYLVTIRVDGELFYSYNIISESKMHARMSAAERFLKHTNGKYALEQCDYNITMAAKMKYKALTKRS